jgi:hypothetical protein
MKLMKLTDDNYRFNDGFIEIEGPWGVIQKQMTEHFSVSLDEIVLAVDWMTLANHNTAHFGVSGRVTHTSNASFVRACIHELEALQSAQRHFHAMYMRDRHSRATHEAADRIKTLWVALNVDGIKALLEDKYEVRSAS